jgi:hypothetical protein
MVRLMANEPIRLQLAELGLTPMTVVIVGGRTEDAILAQLRDAGLVDSRTRRQTPAAGESS